MNNQIASEFRKLTTTRSIYAMAGGLAVVVGLGVVASLRNSDAIWFLIVRPPP